MLGTGEVAGIRRGDRRPGRVGARPTPARMPADAVSRPPRLRGAAGAAPARRRPSRPVLPTYIYDADTPRLLTTPGHYAYVKIAEGCDYTCAFCIIPTLRGAYRSRTAESIVREARGAGGARRRANCC